MPQVGDVLADRYRMEAVLGAGGMATVHRATDLRLERQVAVKVLLPNLAQDESLRMRFDREARALAAVHHPAIVSIYDVDPGNPATGREPFFVMELCEGGSIAERIAGFGRLDPAEVVALGTRIASGLVALHEQGIVHRDVKPQNILLSEAGPKLGDFGIARFDTSHERGTPTEPGAARATIEYAAPEILVGETATAASDVYGLAGVVYEALTGQRPRPAGSPAQRPDVGPPTAAAPWAAPSAAPSVLAPELGTRFDAVLASALAPEPMARPDLPTFSRQLEAALAGWTPTVVIPVPRAATLPRSALPDHPAPRAAGRSGGRGWRFSVVVLAGAAALLLASALVLLAPLLTAPSGTASPGGTASPPSSSTPGATPTAPVAPTPGDPDARVRSALVDLRALVDGLAPESSRDLGARVDEISRSFEDGDIGKATEKARNLESRIEELRRDGKIDAALADQLGDATMALLTALAAMPAEGG